MEDSTANENNKEMQDSDDEEKADVEMECEKDSDSISKNPYLYDVHIDLIKLLKQLGELEQLRDARQRMSELFPLAEGLWLEWLKDEISLAGDDQKERKKVEDLFERAVKDYLSVKIWLEYVQFSIGGMASQDGVIKIREVFEKALSSAGLHVAQGSSLWEAYREFENAILMGVMPAPGQVATKQQEDDFDVQHKRIMALFKRQLSVPLNDMEESFTEYKEWLQGEIDSQIKQQFHKALEYYKKIQPYEKDLVGGMLTKEDKKEVYTSYIDYEISHGTAARVICLYERFVQENCLEPEVWINYTQYLISEELSMVFPVVERLFVNIRKGQKSHQTIKGTVDRALSCGFADGGSYLQIWTTYSDYLRRWIRWDEDHEEQLTLFRANIEKAVEHLCKYRCYGDNKHCRKLLQRALNSVSDWPESIVDAFINFEREEGDLEQYESALSKCNAQMDRIKERRKQAAEKEEGEKSKFQKGGKKQQKTFDKGHHSDKKQQFSKKDKNTKFDKRQNSSNDSGEKVFVKPYQKKETKSDDTSERISLDEDQKASNGLKRKVRKLWQKTINLESVFKVPPPPGFKGQKSGPPPGYKGKKSEPPPGFKGHKAGVTEPPPGYTGKSSEGEEPPAKVQKTDGDDRLHEGQGDMGPDNSSYGDDRLHVDQGDKGPDKSSCTAFVNGDDRLHVDQGDMGPDKSSYGDDRLHVDQGDMGPDKSSYGDDRLHEGQGDMGPDKSSYGDDRLRGQGDMGPDKGSCTTFVNGDDRLHVDQGDMGPDKSSCTAFVNGDDRLRDQGVMGPDKSSCTAFVSNQSFVIILDGDDRLHVGQGDMGPDKSSYGDDRLHEGQGDMGPDKSSYGDDRLHVDQGDMGPDKSSYGDDRLHEGQGDMGPDKSSYGDDRLHEGQGDMGPDKSSCTAFVNGDDRLHEGQGDIGPDKSSCTAFVSNLANVIFSDGDDRLHEGQGTWDQTRVHVQHSLVIWHMM
ncbi:SART3 [Mytilus edulis]|uniref:SART3 n=1 Tax=Mytilus edulis TaxID=6550 RepID=A0A8S3U995_MYTED|nr:SART3 [Mytilus edulis]